jgi:hypothetical protein
MILGGGKVEDRRLVRVIGELNQVTSQILLK